jgi:hypothetical protein
MKKLGLLLFGMHYNTNYYNFNYPGKKTYRIDYRFSLDNYKKFLFDYFIKNNYSIDTYLSTYQSEISDQLLRDYSPKKYNLSSFNPKACRVFSRNLNFINVINLCLNTKIFYDLILITRFDLLFQITFDQINIDNEKLNLVSTLENPDYIDDNLYILPFNKLKSIRTVVKRNHEKMLHFTFSDMKIYCGDINFLYNEPGKAVSDLSFYKIVRR